LVGRGLWSAMRASVTEVYKQPYAPALRTRRGAVLAAIMIGGVISIFLQVPLRIGFVISRPALERLRRELVEHPETPRPPVMRAGIYRVSTTWPSDFGRNHPMFRIYLSGTNEVGFTYSSDPIGYAGRNAGTSGYLQDGWYWFSDD